MCVTLSEAEGSNSARDPAKDRLVDPSGNALNDAPETGLEMQ